MCIIEQETHHIPISQVCDIRNMYLSEKVLTFELVLLDNVPFFYSWKFSNSLCVDLYKQYTRFYFIQCKQYLILFDQFELCRFWKK